jgi:hypothetical protein
MSKEGIIKKSVQAALIASLIIGSISVSSFGGASAQNSSMAQNSSLVGSSDTSRGSGHVELSKVATSTTTITGQATFVGGFDTTYSITGSPWDIKNSKDLIVSSVQDDFGKSSTIGYIKASGTAEGASNMTALANPFASNEQINQKIQELLNKSIEAASDSKTDLVQIKCIFGNSLGLFSCLEYPLVG